MISIITVTFNAEKEIEKTLKSLLEQTFINYELIIKDANSKDDTVKIITKYIPLFEERKISMKLISQEDKGIYDGMNQATDIVKKEWVYFLNAGDTLYDKNSLKEIKENLDSNFDIIYGSVNQVLNKDYFKIRAPLELENIDKGMVFCHQGVIIKTNLMRKERYDLKYKICADYNFFLKMYLENKKFKKINVIFSNYDLNGYSNDNSMKTLKETYEIIKTHKKSNLKIKIYFNFLLLREKIKYYIKNLFGNESYIVFRKINFILKSLKKGEEIK